MASTMKLFKSYKCLDWVMFHAGGDSKTICGITLIIEELYPDKQKDPARLKRDRLEPRKDSGC